MVLPTDTARVAPEAKKLTNKSVVSSKVADILSAITKPATEATTADAAPKEPNRKQREALKKKNAAPRGLPKSGRPWKEVKQK